MESHYYTSLTCTSKFIHMCRFLSNRVGTARDIKNFYVYGSEIGIMFCNVNETSKFHMQWLYPDSYLSLKFLSLHFYVHVFYFQVHL